MDNKTCKQCREEKFLEHFYVGRNICKKCSNSNRNKYYHENRERELSVRKQWIKENPEKRKVTAKKTYEKNKDKRRAYMQKYYPVNRDRHRESSKAWAKRNRDKMNATYNKRRAHQLKATPGWSNEFFISEIYHLAKIRTEITNIKWNVDHVVPLVSNLVCGLHCEANLQVIPEVINKSKNNRHWPDMWE